MAHDDKIKKFDALMALMDEALESMTDEEVLEELRAQGVSSKDSTDAFYAVLEQSADAQRQAVMDSARADREKKIAAYNNQPTRIPLAPSEQLELYRRVTAARPDLTMAARDESKPPTPTDIKTILRQLEVMGILDEFLSGEDPEG